MSESLLEIIKNPEDIKKIAKEDLSKLCDEIRTVLIDTVSQNGGHLASNLGAVELTVSLMREIDLEEDQVVWDVGHQCYTYKLLTGRGDEFSSLRREGGISGFPRISESKYDIFNTGHSSTSIASAFGLALAKQQKGEKGTVFAIIGDGALSGGLAYEGLNNAGRFNGKIVVILNDNKMSISRNVGAMARSLAIMRTKKGYRRLKTGVERFLTKIPLIGKPIYKKVAIIKSAFKNALYKSNIFEDMGFHYIGPIDGHDMEMLGRAISMAHDDSSRPVLIHVCTVKGKGYSYAEANPGSFHGIGEFDVETGERKMSGENFSSVFGDEACKIAENDNTVCSVTAAMKTGTGLEGFAQKYPKRFYDVGIAEECAVTMSAGLAANGMKPIIAIYSTFLQRAYDQIIHDAVLQNRKMVLAIDRAGFTGDDGETHQGLFDAAFLNTVCGINLYSPTYYDELRNMLNTAIYEDIAVSAVRYPRGKEPVERPGEQISAGKETYDMIRSDGSASILLVSYGKEFGECLKARESLLNKGIACDILKLNRIVPIDDRAVDESLKYECIYFAEEGVRRCGIGETFALKLSEKDYKGKYRLRAVENAFTAHASVTRQLELSGLSGEQIAEWVISQ